MAAPYMAMNVGGKRRKFAFFLTSETARPFRAELPELWPRLSEEVTDRIVEQTPGLDDLQRDFYKATLDARRKYVLGPAYRMALKEAETSTATVGNDTLATDIPGIVEHVRGAAASANDAFSSLRGMVDGARGGVVAFTQDGLPQYTRLATTLRNVADNVNELVSSLKRNPSRVLSGPKTPDFRR